MASPIGNMVIKVDLDGSGFNKGVTGLNRQMRMVSKELSANLSKFSRYDNSLEKSKVKVDGLTKRQKVQKEIVKELRQNYDRLSAETGENSAKTQAAASKYNEAAAKLNQYDHELEEAKKHMKSLQDHQRALNTTLGKLGNNFSKFGPHLKTMGDGMKNVGRSMSMYVTAPIVGGFGAAVKASIDYESAFAGVRKTVNGSEKDYKKLSDGIIKMSKNLPVAATDIAEVGEMAGQLGIKKSNILDFSKTIIDLGESTNLTREQAATEFARFANIVDMPQKSFSRLGSSIVALGNNMATTESEIMSMSMRIAAQGKLVGMTESDITGLAATMSSLGIEAEAGGTAMTTVLKKIDKAVGYGGDALKEFAEASGVSSKEFKKQWESDPIKALDTFIGGLSESKKEGANLSDILANLGIKGIRESDTILRMANNHKLLGKAVQISGKGWKENKALSNEANQRYKTMASQLKILKNNVVAFGISLGDAIAPIVIKLAKGLTGVLKSMSNMSNGMKITIAVVGSLVAAIGPVVFIFGSFISVIGSAMTTLGPLLVGISKAGGVMAFLSGKVATLVKLFPALGPAISFAGGPLLWIVGGLTALGIAFTVAYKKSETFRNIVNKAVSGVMNVFKAAKIALQGFFQLFKGNGQDGIITLSKIFPPNVVVGITSFADKIKNTFIQVVNAIKGFASQVGGQLTSFWNQNGAQITEAVQNIANVISTVFKFIWGNIIRPIMTLIWNLMKIIWPGIKWLVVSVWGNIKGVISGALNVIMGVIKVFAGLFTGDFRKMWEGIKQIFKGALQLIWNGIQLMLVGKILGAGKVFIQLFKSILSGGWKAIISIFRNSLGFIYKAVSSGFSKTYSFTKNIFTLMRKSVNTILDHMRTGIKNIVQSIYAIIKNAFTKSFSSSKNIFSKLRNFCVNLWKGLRDSISNLALRVYVNVRSSFTRLYDNSLKLFRKLRSFMSDIWTSIRRNTVDKVASLYKGVKNHFEKLFSSSKSINQRLRDFMSNIWRGIKDKTTGMARNIKDAVLGSFRSMRDKLKGIVGKIKDHIGGMVKGVKKGLNKLIDGVNAVATKIGMDKFKKIKLSTGTVKHNHSLSDNQGRLKQHTRAIVGDKGPGNGPGGFRHEMIEYPNGRLAMTPKTDTEVILPKGSRVHNGTATYNYLNTPQFSTGTLPRFSLGSWLDDKKKDAGKYAGKKMAQANNAGKQIINGTKDTAKALKKGFDKAIGDVWDFASNPGKLVDKVMSHFGVDFGSLPELPRKMMAGMYKKLKEGVKDLFGGWLEDSGGGDGSSFTKYAITTPYSPNKAVAGYGFNGGRHYGIDYATPVGTTLTAPTSGTISKLSNYGGGTVAKLLSGKFTQFFMHLKDIFKTGKVKQGEKFAHTGNSGHWTTGPHLHYQVEKGHSADITNRNTVDPAKFLSGKGGGKQAPSQWRSTIQRAARRMKVNLSSKEMNGIIAQIQRESGGDASVTQGNIGDINNLRGTPAQGLLQYVPSTFKAYAMKGHGNIKSGYDQLLAFFNNSNWRKNLPYGRSGWGPTGSRRFATGGKVWNGFYHLGEEGYPEWIIPSDPKRSEDSWKLLALAANDLEKNSPKSKRPNNLPNPSTGSGSSNSNLEKKFDMLLSLVSKLVSSNEAIANKDYEPVIDKYSLENEVFKLIEKYERTKKRKGRYNPAT
ncbi:MULTISPECIES: phage tail tape measure protein [Mammaliicoccus]|uniref:phage tail tape measure protein n=1 Tax=Mammaliicoccus TaxID=2803850 RepID=UPI00065B867B|nr:MULTISPECIES: phage tail tape measure protein [Mammaliicoccus]AQN32271.1 tail tape-measure protein [Staphylococcus phage phi879]MCD5140448.1 phage tail tape measure protein [Mammaliicoccus sciuri]PNY96185.1 phage tail tape measure protein [Mammaliicoccus sciuri]SQE50886.1 phage tail tape measure protein, TP901 family, core region [Mammaliicoccus sciuri]